MISENTRFSFHCYSDPDPRKAPRFLVNHRHGATEQPLHLVAEAGMHSAAVAVNIQGPHELRERTTQDQLTALGAYRFGRDPREDQAREVLPKGSLPPPTAFM